MKYLLSLLILVSALNNDKTDFLQEKMDIMVYGSDTCHYCIDTKEFLKENKINFVYYDIDLDMEKQAEMIEKLRKAGISLSNLSLPVIDKKGEIFTNEEDFEKFLLKIKED